MKIIERIALFIESQEKSINAFEKKIGTSIGVINKAIAKRTEIQSKWIAKIYENYPKISLEWLLTGEGEMLKPTVKDRFLEYIEQGGITEKTMRDEVIATLPKHVESVRDDGMTTEKMDAFAIFEHHECYYDADIDPAVYDAKTEYEKQREFAECVLKLYPEISRKWLLTGMGSMTVTECNATVFTIPGNKKDNYDFAMRFGKSDLLPEYNAGDIVACKVVGIMDIKN